MSAAPIRRQRILVTGASSGLGRALARQLAANGANVLVTARRAERLAELAAEFPKVEPYPLDVTDSLAVATFCRSVGRLDGAVLNAGITSVAPFLSGGDMADADMVETNVLANTRLARALHGPLQGGRLVFVGSLAGEVPLPYQAVYSGTKGFIRNFGLALREEWKGAVSVGVFAPGGIATEMTDVAALSKLQKTLADVDDVADALLSFYMSDKAYKVPGRVNRLSSGVANILPTPLVTKAMERVYRPKKPNHPMRRSTDPKPSDE